MWSVLIAEPFKGVTADISDKLFFVRTSPMILLFRLIKKSGPIGGTKIILILSPMTTMQSEIMVDRFWKGAWAAFNI